jgi:hypothetical protein
VIRDFLKKNPPNKGVNQIKLPIIKEKKDKNQFQDLVHIMKVRKRGHGGLYDADGNGIQSKVE